jgi:hypothetical protein
MHSFSERDVAGTPPSSRVSSAGNGLPGLYETVVMKIVLSIKGKIDSTVI